MRRLSFSTLIALVCSLPLLASFASAADQCTLHKITSFDMTTNADGSVGIPVQIAGQTFNMEVDTGGFDSLITESAAKKLDLTAFYSWSVNARFFGGYKMDHYVTAHDFVFGGLRAPRFNFFVIDDGFFPPGIDGLLGPELLHAFDDDFDFANGKLNLFSPDHCPGRVVYWTKEQPITIVPMKLDPVGHIKLAVQLDGKDVRALLDTGAPISYLSFEVARNVFGVDPKSPDLKPAGWRNYPGAVRYPFKTLVIEGITVNNPDIVLVPDNESKIGGDTIQGLVGMNVLRSLHLYIAYKERALYVTPASAH